MTQTLESIVSIYDVKNLPTEKLCNLLKYRSTLNELQRPYKKREQKDLKLLLKERSKN